MDNSTFSHSSSVQPAGSSEQAPSGASGTHWPAVDSARASLGRARTAAHEAVDRLASGASGWVDRIDDKTQGLNLNPQRAWAYTRSAVQDHPVPTVLVSILAGYAIARLIGMRNWH